MTAPEPEPRFVREPMDAVEADLSDAYAVVGALVAQGARVSIGDDGVETVPNVSLRLDLRKLNADGSLTDNAVVSVNAIMTDLGGAAYVAEALAAAIVCAVEGAR